MRFLQLLFVAAIAFSLLAFGTEKGWQKAGSQPKAYYMGLDKTLEKNGAMPSTIRSIEDNIEGYGTLLNSLSAEPYRGKTLRMTGYMRSKELKNWAGFWLRLDGQKNKSLGFDNMFDRPVKGTTGWKKYEIIMEVPEETQNIAYGALLQGTGQIWFADIHFEEIKS